MENLPNSLSGKMSVEHLPLTKEKTSDVSSNSSQKLKTRTYQFLNLVNGNKQEKSWESHLVLHGECWMPSISESPKEERESSLSQILQEEVPNKYYLTKKACRGILARAQMKQKQLPLVLERALQNQSEEVT